MSIIAPLIGRADLAASFIAGLTGPITLGGVSFESFEVPEALVFGGQHQTTVHRLPGGARVIDAMGPDDATIDWSGIFLGSNATLKAQRLNILRNTGAKVTLSWSTFHYTVVVANFKATYLKEAHLQYDISCIVLEDRSTAGAPSLISAALQILSDVSQAIQTAATIVGMPPQPTADMDAAEEATTANEFRLGSAEQIAATNALATASASTAAARDTAGASLAAAALAAPAGGLASGPTALIAAVSQAGVAAGMAAANGYCGRATINSRQGTA